MKTLIVIDVQNDFVTGPLGTPEAQAIIPKIVEKIKNHEGPVVCTLDTHYEDYEQTLEGKRVPPHCIDETDGCELVKEVDEAIESKPEYDVTVKGSFGADWHNIEDYQPDHGLTDFIHEADEFEIIGLCTDICVVSNALILRSMFPDTPITVDASCCAGTTPQNHDAACAVMKSCLIDVING